MSEIVIAIKGTSAIAPLTVPRFTTYSGWDDLSVGRNLNAVCGDFQFNLAATLTNFPIADTASINPGAEAVVTMKYGAAGVLEHKLITGFINHVTRDKEAGSTELKFSGRDKTADLVDCSAVHLTNSWKKASILEICIDICKPFGITVGYDSPDAGTFVDNFTIQNGETSFAAIERLCRAFGILPITNSDGELILSAIGNSTADVTLEVGKNIKKITTEEDDSGRFSEYICRGQPRGNGSTWTRNNIQLLGEAVDVDVDRYRPMIIIAEKNMTATEIARRAAWEAQVRAGRASRASVVVRGWLQDPDDEWSRPWTLGEIVELKDETWNVDAELVISSLVFSLAEGAGRLSTMELSPPEIFKADPTQEIKLARKSSVRPS